MANDALIAAARSAAAHAYAPYSGFGVGAAVLLDGGAVMSGCNFENASYGLTLCAETVALGNVASMGRLRDVREIAVIGGRIEGGAIRGDDPVRPCGRCRQVILEVAQVAGVDLPIYCASADGAVAEQHSISALLPLAFGPESLKR